MHSVMDSSIACTLTIIGGMAAGKCIHDLLQGEQLLRICTTTSATVTHTFNLLSSNGIPTLGHPIAWQLA